MKALPSTLPIELTTTDNRRACAARRRGENWARSHPVVQALKRSYPDAGTEGCLMTLAVLRPDPDGPRLRYHLSDGLCEAVNRFETHLPFRAVKGTLTLSLL